MADNKTVPVGTLVIAGFFLLLMLTTYLLVKPPPRPPELKGVLRPQFSQIEAFQLTGQHGEMISESNFRGKWSFVFFGYTSCPDVCPATLHLLNSVEGLVGDENGESPNEMQVLFVSVDPQRDSIESLGRYVSYFNQAFIGATADSAQIDRLARQFGAAYLVEAETAPDQYLVSHTSAIFLVDPLGRLVATFSQPHYASTIFTQYKKIRSYVSGIG